MLSVVLFNSLKLSSSSFLSLLYSLSFEDLLTTDLLSDLGFEELLTTALNEAILQVNKCTQQELQDLILNMQDIEG